MPAKPAPQARVPRSLSVPADLDAAWSAVLDARGESRPQWIARHVQEDQQGTVQALREALEALLPYAEAHIEDLKSGMADGTYEEDMDTVDDADVWLGKARAALAATKEE